MASLTQTKNPKSLVFNVEEVTFGIDIGAVKEVFKTNKIFTLARTSKIMAGIVNLRGQIISIFNMGELLFKSSKKKAIDFTEKESIIVLVNIENQDIGLLVDQVIHLTDIKELQELDPKELKKVNLSLTPAITNIGISSDSSAYLLDIEKMLEDFLSTDSIFLSGSESGDFDDFDYEKYSLPDSQEATKASDTKVEGKEEVDDFDYDQFTLPDSQEENVSAVLEVSQEETKKSTDYSVEEATELMKNMTENDLIDFTEGDNRKTIQKIVEKEPEEEETSKEVKTLDD